MFPNPSHVCSLLPFCFLLTEGAIVSDRYTLPRDGYKLNDLYVDREVTCSSMAACAATCSPEDCETISFKADEGRCLHFYHSSTDTHTVELMLVEELGWTTMSRVVYTVFLVRRHDQSDLSYAEALSICAEFKTDLASQEDMLAARELRLKSCNCGWLSGETIQHSPNVTCTQCGQETIYGWCRL